MRSGGACRTRLMPARSRACASCASAAQHQRPWLFARTYAVTKNGATWATPVASGQSLRVDALENVNLFFGGLGGIVPVSMTVGASAQGRCQRTTSACLTWPITVEINEVQLYLFPISAPAS